MATANKYNNGECPFCGSDRLVRAGKQFDKSGAIQRYLCKDCRKMTVKPKKPEVVD